MVAIGCGRRLPAFFFRCDFFLVELEDCFPIFLDPAAFFDLRNFPCDEAPECRFGFRLGFNFNVSAATVNPSTSSRLIDVRMSRSIAANLFCSCGETREIALPLLPALAVRPIRCT